MPGPWLGMAIVMAALGGLLGGLAYLQKHFPGHPELFRKLLHIGMGLVTLSFPWLFQENWPVIVLAVTAILVLLGLKWRGADSAGIHNVVHGVARDSLGEIYFPIAVAILFLLTRENTILFTIPVLILTLADAVAALIGVRYGKIHYSTAEGVKSTEGSVAFFVVTFMSVHIPLLLLTTTGRVETLLIALILGVLVMLLEALAWRGLDNLFIPLGGYLLLKVYLDMGASDLLMRLVVSIALVLFVILWRKRTTLLDSAALSGALIGYLVWAVAGWQWFLPVLLLFVTYTTLSPKNELNSVRMHDVRAVLAVCLPGMVWLFLARSENWAELYFPFTVSFAIQLGLIGLARLRFQNPATNKASLLLRCIIIGGVIIFIPWILITGVTLQSLLYVIAGQCLVAGAVISFYYWQPCLDNCPTDTPRWWRQGSLGLLYSALSLLLISYYPLR